MKKTYRISETLEKKRLDKALVQLDDTLTRTRIKTLIDDHHVTLNDKPTKPSQKVMMDDVITIDFPDVKPLELTPVNLGLDIVYQDETLAVINKPSGLVVHPSHTSDEATLVHGLLAEIKDFKAMDDTVRPGIVHRIDKETSGLLVVAKTKEALLALQKELKAHKAKREYVALVEGVIPHNLGKIDAPVGRDEKNRQNMTVLASGKPAITHFEVMERFDAHTLVRCKLESGRTHQIRVHMQYIGHPIVGDPKYGRRKTDTAHGQFLHAQTLGFTHPKTQLWQSFEANLPEYFTAMLETLRGEQSG